MYQLNNFDDKEKLDQALAENVSQILQSAIALKGRASIAVGRKPKEIYS